MRLDPTPAASDYLANVVSAPFEGRIDGPVEIFDTTLREGEQTPGVVFTPDDKLAIAEGLDGVGVDVVSIGFPAVSKEESRAARRIIEGGFGFETAALSRTVHSDIDAAVDVGVDIVSIILGGSDSHLHDKLHLTEDEAVEVLDGAVRHAVRQGVRCGFALEDFSRTPLARMLRLSKTAVDAGAYLVYIPDTIGVLTPTATSGLVRLVKAALPDTPISLHFHNDLGLALANTLAGLEAGANQAQATVNGVGERCGNTALEELAVVLEVKYGLDTGLALDRLWELSRLVHVASRTEPAPHKPVTGKWCFSHESGIHVSGLLANRDAYQPYPPEIVGRHHEILFGKHSGLAGLRKLAAAGGLDLPQELEANLLARIKEEAERRRGPVADDEILNWLGEALEARSAVPSPS